MYSHKQTANIPFSVRHGEGLGMRSDSRLPLQLRINKHLQIPIENSRRIARLHIGPQVFDHLVRMQNVAANLLPEVGTLRGTLQIFFLRHLLATFPLQKFRTENVHRESAVLELRALRLARDDDAGGDVCETDGGLDFVDVLSAGAATAEGIDAQIVRIDLDLLGLGNLGEDFDQRKAGLPQPLGTEGRNPHQPVCPLFAFEIAVCHLTDDGERGSLDPRFLTIGLLEQIRLPSQTLAVPQIHPYQHRRPVLRFGPARATADRQVAVGCVELAAKIELRLLFLPARLERVELRLQFGKIGLAGNLREIDQLLQFARNLRDRLPLLAERLQFGEETLRTLLVRPNGGIGCLPFQLGNLCWNALPVKESPCLCSPPTEGPIIFSAAHP